MIKVPGAEDLLRAHVERRADHRPSLGAAVDARLLHALRDTEVEELHEDLASATGIAEVDVPRLDVPMDDAALVRAIERACELTHDLDDEVGRHPRFLVEVLTEVAPLEELHHDVRNALVGDAVIERLHDVRALHLRSRGGLAREAILRFLVALQAARDELHDDLRAEREMVGDPYRAHAAFAERANQLDARRHHHPREGLGHVTKNA